MVVWGLLLIWLAVGAYLESLSNPGQPGWHYLWQGGVGGNGYNAWLATLSGGFLTTEVIIMIFTLRSNQARVERAEKAGDAKVATAVAAAEERNKAAVAEAEERNKAAVAEAEERTKTAVAEAEERAKAAVAEAVEAADASAREKLSAELAARQQAWEGWNERRLAAEREGRPFTEPPPGTASGMNGSGSA